jgi:uncharacterized protein (DUF608 family)
VSHEFAGPYDGAHAERIGYPLGGIGAGSMCLTGHGSLEAVSLRHHAGVLNKPFQFASVCVKGVADGARLLEGPLPMWKINYPWGNNWQGTGGGGRDNTFGLPRFDHGTFTDRFPAAQVSMTDDDLPLAVTLTGFSPFIPGDADASSQPVIVLEYALTNTSDQPIELIVGYHSANFMKVGREGSSIEVRDDGYVLKQDATEAPHHAGQLRVACESDDVCVDAAWMRSGWWDAAGRLWRDIVAGTHRNAVHNEAPMTPGVSVTRKLTLGPGQTDTVRLRISWYVPDSDLQQACGDDCDCGTHQPRYAELYDDVDAVDAALVTNLADWRERSFRFGELLANNSLPPVIREAISANLGILRSPTVLRQRDGRLWLWEGCHDDKGCCHGSCTHVWNWAQAFAHLFPELERGLRETEHGPGQFDSGHQEFRVPLPISDTAADSWTAVDGQLGGVIKVCRDWRVCGDDVWLANILPRVRQSIEYMISTFDPDRSGVIRGAQHNTWDIEFHGPNGMSLMCYLAALTAMDAMCEHLGEDRADYAAIADKCRTYLEETLFNGRTFIQQIQADEVIGEHKRPMQPPSGSPELVATIQKEGPSYQYGNGVMSTVLLGEWMAETAGLSTGLDRDKVLVALQAIYTHNNKPTLKRHANPQRPGYGCGDEPGLINCSWPDDDAPTIPFPYFAEVFSSVEYQNAAHLLRYGQIDEALELVGNARTRYNGLVRNPFDEIECGHWYGRMLACYDLIAAWGGVRYDAVTRTMHVNPVVDGDVDIPFVNGDRWGMVEVRDGKASYRPINGDLPIDHWEGPARG